MFNDLLAALRSDPEREIYKIEHGPRSGYYTCTYRDPGKPLPLATQQEINWALFHKKIKPGKNPHNYVLCS